MTAGDARLDAIQARFDAATPGPWEVRTDDLTDDVDVVHDQEHVSFVASCGHKAQPGIYADAEFIANAPADVAYLLAELRKAHEALAAVAEVGEQLEASNLNDNEFMRGRGSGFRIAGVRIRHTIRAAVAAANGDGA